VRLYVAARFGQYERARALIDDVTALGHRITHDWTRTEEFGPDGHPFHHESNGVRPPGADRYAHHAENDIRAAAEADLLIALADEPLTGGMIEIGVALASRTDVWVCAPWRWTVFWEHPLVTLFESETVARARLTDEARVASNEDGQ
jgi:hypothetical protein